MAATILILLTGATGYIGGRLLKALEAQERPVRCVARQPEFLRADVAFAFRHGGVFVNDSRVVNANISSPNAIFHVLDTVLLPPPPKPNLLEVLKNDGRFGTLVLALQAAGLDSVVATGGPLTIFAPTDEAFDALPPGEVARLLADTDALKHVLLYHVVSGSKTASDLLRQFKVTTLQGSSAYVYS